MSSMVDASRSADGEGADVDADPDPFGSDRIELDDAELRAASPGAWLAGLRERLDDAATRLTYGRSE